MGPWANVQEVRDALAAFRAAPTSADDSKDGQRPRKFTIAVADTFGEGGPVRGIDRVCFRLSKPNPKTKASRLPEHCLLLLPLRFSQPPSTDSMRHSDR